MKNNHFSDEEIDLIRSALLMRCNRIESGNPDLSAHDAQQRKLPVQALSEYQMRLILKIKDLIRFVETGRRE